MITKFLHTRFRVSDIEQSIDFYTKTFRLELVERKESSRGSKLVFLKVPNSDETIELCEYHKSGPIDVSGKDLVHIAFAIESFDAFSEHLKTVGVPYSQEPDGHIAFVDDPDGYEIELIKK